MVKTFVLVIGSLRKKRPICINIRLPVEITLEETSAAEDARLRFATKGETIRDEYYKKNFLQA